MQVELAASGCSVEPKTIKLFVDEHLDAPAAIFVVKPRNQSSSMVLQFAVYQDGGLIVSANHLIEVMETGRIVNTAVSTNSRTVPILEDEQYTSPENYVAQDITRDAQASKEVDAQIQADISNARAALEAGRYPQALTILDQAQTRGVDHAILKYHAEIDRLREAAQERQGWQARVKESLGQAARLQEDEAVAEALRVLNELLATLRSQVWTIWARMCARCETACRRPRTLTTRKVTSIERGPKRITATLSSW